MAEAHGIHIEAPAEKVFDWFKYPRNWRAALTPTGREVITQVHVTPEGLGTFHVWAMKPLPGVRFETFRVFTEFVPNKRIVDKWSMALEGDKTYSFEAEGTGTRVTFSRERQSLWRIRALDKLVDRFERREDERALRRVKQLMESGVSVTAR